MALDDVQTSAELEQRAFFTPQLVRDILQSVDPEIDPPQGIINMLAMDANNHEMNADNPAASIEAVEAGVRSAFEYADGINAAPTDANIAHVQQTLNLILSGADGAIASIGAQQFGGVAGPQTAEEKEKKRTADAMADIALAQAAAPLADIPIDPAKVDSMFNFFMLNASDAQKTALADATSIVIDENASDAERKAAAADAAATVRDGNEGNPETADMTPEESEAHAVEVAREVAIKEKANELMQENDGMTLQQAREAAAAEVNPFYDELLESTSLSAAAELAANNTLTQGHTLSTGAAIGAFATSSDFASVEAEQAIRGGSSEEQLDSFVSSLEATIIANGEHGITLVERAQDLQDKVDQLRASPLADRPEIRALIEETETQIESINETMDSTTNMNGYLTEVKSFIENNREQLLESSMEEVMTLAFENEDLIASYQDMVADLSEEERQAFVMETARRMGVSEEFAQEFYEREMQNTETYLGFESWGDTASNLLSTGSEFITGYADNGMDFLNSFFSSTEDEALTTDSFIAEQTKALNDLKAQRDSLAENALVSGGGPAGSYYQGKLDGLDTQIAEMEEQLSVYEDAIAKLNEAQQAAEASADTLDSVRQDLNESNTLTIAGADGNEYYVFANEDGSYSMGGTEFMDGYRAPSAEELQAINDAINEGAVLGTPVQRASYEYVADTLSRNQTEVSIAQGEVEIIDAEQTAKKAIDTVNEMGAQQAAMDPDGIGFEQDFGMGRMGGAISPIATTQDRMDYQMEVAAQAEADAEAKRQEITELEGSLQDGEQVADAPDAPATDEAQMTIDQNPELKSYLEGLSEQTNIPESDLKAELEARGVPSDQIDRVMEIADAQMGVNIAPRESTPVVTNGTLSANKAAGDPAAGIFNEAANQPASDINAPAPSPQSPSPEEIEIAARAEASAPKSSPMTLGT